MLYYENTTNVKIVQSGAVNEVYRFLDSRLNYGNFADVPPYRSDDENSGNSYDYESSLYRTKTCCRRLIDSNVFQYQKPKEMLLPDSSPVFPPTHLVLTKKDKTQDLGSALGDFFNFMKRFEYELEKDLKYVCVPEFHKLGGIHFHTIFFNQDYIHQRQILNIWANKNSTADYSAYIQRADRIRGIGRYVTKYISKSFFDSRFKGHKKYHPSNGLIRPKIIYNQEENEKTLADLSAFVPSYQKNYVSKYNGNVQYSLYDLPLKARFA